MKDKKTNYYYYPLCTSDYVFENIFASESVSPICFYKKRQFGIDYFYKIPNIHNENAIILFNNPPKFSIDKLNTDSIKFILAIDADYIKEEGTVLIGNDNILGYQKTIYLNKDNFKIYFFSEKDKKIAWMRSENSLPTKGLKKYENNFSILSENSCKEFLLNGIDNLKIDQNELEKEIQFDRKFNYFKGLVYGIIVGVISLKPKEEIQLKRSIQEITNAFAELKNRLENDFKSKKRVVNSEQYNSSKLDKFKRDFNSLYIERLISKINESERLFNICFPNQQFSEESIINFLMVENPVLFKSEEKAKEEIEYRKFNDKIEGTEKFNMLIEFYLKKTKKISFYENIKTQSYKYIELNSYSDKEEINNNFKGAIYELEKFIHNEFITQTSDKKFDLNMLKFDFKSNKIVFNQDFQKLSSSDIEEFTAIVNLTLNNTKQGKGETSKEQILSLVEKVGNVSSKQSDIGRATTLYRYLNNEIKEYSSTAPRSVVMANFVAFAFNPDSLEKLQNYLEAKSIENSWIGLTFWCTFNGFSDISKNFLKPIFDTSNELMQREIDNYLEKSYLKFSDSNEKSYIQKVNLDSYTSEPNELKNSVKEFYQTYNISDKYKISFDEFKEIRSLKTKEKISNKIKITKTNLNKLLASFDKFMNSNDLFIK